MGAGKNCLLFSLVVVIGLGIAGFIYKDKIIDYINYQLSKLKEVPVVWKVEIWSSQWDFMESLSEILN